MRLSNRFQLILLSAIFSCSAYAIGVVQYDSYPMPAGQWEECRYSVRYTSFCLWAPTANRVRLNIYSSGSGNNIWRTLFMQYSKEDGLWKTAVNKDLNGKFYTFQIQMNGRWLAETPGLWAKAVGINGRRASILDLSTTNPSNWAKDYRPALKNFSDITIYEMHYRDLSASKSSGIKHRGKFLALTEENTHTSDGLSTGIDHLKELGVTHVHVLPSFDFASVDERDSNRYNWGYDPQNYNVPDGAYSTNPYDPKVRIMEFKKMVMALHHAGIRVVLDVVYNHTSKMDGSNFQLTVPSYFYRTDDKGAFSNASGCGNETASERPMMRLYMIQSVLYWAKEYHIDGFRFDLMGVHDIETMNGIRKALDAYDSSIFVYGEGWAAGAPAYSPEKLAMKANIVEMPRIAAFGDEMRDALRGPFSDDNKAAFLGAVPGSEMSIKFGIVGAIWHPQILYDKVNYSTKPWALQPTQAISYVSCHDDMCLADRLKASIPNATESELLRLDKLAQTIVFTSQGVPFMFNGEEMFRSKKGVHNSFDSPDSINAIDWSLKSKYKDLFEYYKGLIALRKAHPAFRMGSADVVREKLKFLPVNKDNVIAYTLNDHAAGDQAKQIVVVFNSNAEDIRQMIDNGKYKVLCRDGEIKLSGLGTIDGGEIIVPKQSALILSK